MLTQTIIRARIYYDFWWFLEGSQTFPSIEETLNDFPDFFRFARHSYFISMIVQCAIVWDKGRDKIGLEQIASSVLDCGRYPEHQDIKLDIARRKSEANGLVEIRHGAIAHRSSNESYSEVFERAGIVPNSIATMLSAWLDIANKLRQRRNMEFADFRDMPLQHLQSLIHKLGGPDLRPSSWLDEILQA